MKNLVFIEYACKVVFSWQTIAFTGAVYSKHFRAAGDRIFSDKYLIRGLGSSNRPAPRPPADISVAAGHCTVANISTATDYALAGPDMYCNQFISPFV
jgi:hypothetical protein